MFDKYAVNIPEFVNIKYDNEIKINPSFLSENDFIIRNGEIKLKDGDVAGAFVDFDKAVKMFPNKSEPYYKRGRIYFEKNQFAMSIGDFNKAISIDKISTYYTSRGIAYLKLDQYDKVIEDLTTASKLDPTSFTPWAYLGVTYTKVDNYKQAVVCLNKVVDLFDGDAYCYYYLGLAQYYTGNWTKANEALTKSVALNPKKSIKHLVYELRGRTRFVLRDFSGAIKDSEVVTNLLPNDPEPHYLKGKALMELGLRNEALRCINKAISLGSVDAEQYIKRIS